MRRVRLKRLLCGLSTFGSTVCWLAALSCTVAQGPGETTAPLPVPRAPQLKSVRVLASGVPLAQQRVAFTEPGSGALIELAQTNEDGVASASAPWDVVVTVVDEGLLTSFYDVADGASLDVGVGLDQTPGTLRELRTSYEAVDGAAAYRMSVACAIGRTHRLDNPGAVMADESCLSERGTVDAIAYAYDPDGQVLAAAARGDLALPEEGRDVAFSSWTTDVHEVRVEWTDGPEPSRDDIVSSLHVGRDHRWFGAHPSTFVEASLNAGPTGFGHAAELRQRYRVGGATVRRFERRSGTPDAFVVSLDDFEGGVQSTYDPAIGVLTIALDGTALVPLAFRAGLLMIEGDGTAFYWRVVGPVTRTRFAAPRLPVPDLTTSVPLEGEVDLVSADAATAAALDHWHVGVRSFLPVALRQAAAFQWIVSSESLGNTEE